MAEISSVDIFVRAVDRHKAVYSVMEVRALGDVYYLYSKDTAKPSGVQAVFVCVQHDRDTSDPYLLFVVPPNDTFPDLGAFLQLWSVSLLPTIPSQTKVLVHLLCVGERRLARVPHVDRGVTRFEVYPDVVRGFVQIMNLSWSRSGCQCPWEEVPTRMNFDWSPLPIFSPFATEDSESPRASDFGRTQPGSNNSAEVVAMQQRMLALESEVRLLQDQERHQRGLMLQMYGLFKVGNPDEFGGDPDEPRNIYRYNQILLELASRGNRSSGSSSQEVPGSSSSSHGYRADRSEGPT